MKVLLCRTISEYKKLKLDSSSIGLVPTMGNLHKAHLDIIKTSLEQNKTTIVTIFVNPLQFGQGEDFNSYPRTLEEDLKKIESLSTTTSEIIVFAPQGSNIIFPKGYSTTIHVGEIGKELEGKFRPTHFEGVATVVYRLFSIFRPLKAYFGEKDFQQLYIIKKMVKDLNLDVEVIPVKIGREPSGLAMSSRNSFLSETEKKQALKLRRSLLKVKSIISKQGIDSANEYIKKVKLQDDSFNYLELRNAKSLNKISKKTKAIVILGTYQINSTRLLDNETVEIK